MTNLNVQCPHCQTVLRTPYSVAGRSIQCPSCGQSFVANAAPPMGNTFAPPPPPPPRMGVQGQPNFSSSPNQAAGVPVPVYCILGLSLLMSAAALFFAFNSSGLPKVKLETNPKKAVLAYLTNEIKYFEKDSYFFRKNKTEILKSLAIKEIKTNGRWAVAFYKLSLGATEVKDTMMLYKVNDGYWIRCSMYAAEKKCPEKWLKEMKEKSAQFKKDSGEFDIFDI